MGTPALGTPDPEVMASRAGTSRWRAALQRAIEISISLGFLLLALRGINLAVLWQGIRSANPWWLLACALLTTILLFIKAWRWQLLFLPEYHPRYSSVFTAMAGGYLASNVLPARMGELVRLVLLVSDEPVSGARTLSTMVVERLLDVLSLLAVMVMILPFVDLPPVMMRGAQALGIMALVAAMAMVLLSFWKDRLMRWAHLIFGKVSLLDRPAIYSALEHVIDGFAALRGRLGLIQIVLSLVCWGVVVGMAWTAARAVQLDVPITAIVVVIVITSLGMLVPSSPGYIGVFEYLTTVALAPFGVPKEQALAYAIVYHGVNYLTLCLAGLIALWVHGTSLGKAVQRFRPQGPPAA
jgi:hypothetical protein